MFKNTCVKMLSGADFDNKEPWKLRSPRCSLVLFFADWCGHCQNLKPTFIDFADMAQFCTVAAVDSQANADLLNKIQAKASPIKIKGYPTIWMYKDGKPLKEYNGERTKQALLKAAMTLCDKSCSCHKN